MSATAARTEEPAEEPQVAVVTGAAGGLGRAICASLAAKGMHVVVTDIAADGAERVAGELNATGGSAASVELDATDRGQVEQLVARVVAEHGRLDVLVNLAGVMRNALLTKIDDADLDAVLTTHVGSTVNMMRAAVPVMRDRRYGRIVNMSSIAARGSIAGSTYGAAKGALEALTRSAAMEVAPHGITVNCVAPGVIDAGVFLTVPPDYRDEVLARVPVGRVGTPEDVAACVAFLASPEASYVTGQTLLCCGGLSLGF